MVRTFPPTVSGEVIPSVLACVVFALRDPRSFGLLITAGPNGLRFSPFV
jgi:hypothetical protein